MKQEIRWFYLSTERGTPQSTYLLSTDHPPALSESAITGFVAHGEVLIVTDAEACSMLNLEGFLCRPQHIKDTMNPDLHVLGIVANRVDNRRRLIGVMLNEVWRSFGDEAFRACIPYDTAVPTSIRERIPLRKLPWRYLRNDFKDSEGKRR
jgi:chromosome partitioning protein